MFVTMMCVQAPDHDAIREDPGGITCGLATGTMRLWQLGNPHKMLHYEHPSGWNFPTDIVSDTDFFDI